jgi:rare lipoprotein A
VVLASWYGPGFYGNRTACGQTYTPEILGVAHRSLACGTLVTLAFRGKSLTVPVIDRGPYVAGRALDLSNATKLALGCTDLCTLSLRVAP